MTGSDGTSAGSAPDPTTRAAAASSAASTDPACTGIGPFYWEIGDRNGLLANGAIGSTYGADTLMPIASASKFIYAAYVLQVRAGQLSADDVQYLTFRSGYIDFNGCARGDTVHGCATDGTNGVQVPAAVGKFSYGGGHMEQHADRFMGLGAADNAALATTITSTLQLSAPANTFLYTQPQLAGGIATTPSVYAGFLRKLLDGSLVLGAHLADDPVCTNPTLCPGQALYSPVPSNENTQYGLGHWIEDPVLGAGAYSSPGKFGFYPWIDQSRQYYGIVARAVQNTAGADGAADPTGEQQGVLSMYCGRVIRAAWMSGAAT